MFEHMWIGGCCEFCGHDDHDLDLPEFCEVEREPVVYTTGPEGHTDLASFSCDKIFYIDDLPYFCNRKPDHEGDHSEENK